MTRRHVGGPAHFDDAEAASFGPTLRHLQRVLEETTGALRIYTAAMGESHPHFHAHMVPRTPQMPKDAKAWGVFDLQRAAGAGEITVAAAEVVAVAVDSPSRGLRAGAAAAPGALSLRSRRLRLLVLVGFREAPAGARLPEVLLQRDGAAVRAAPFARQQVRLQILVAERVAARADPCRRRSAPGARVRPDSAGRSRRARPTNRAPPWQLLGQGGEPPCRCSRARAECAPPRHRSRPHGSRRVHPSDSPEAQRPLAARTPCGRPCYGRRLRFATESRAQSGVPARCPGTTWRRARWPRRRAFPAASSIPRGARAPRSRQRAR